MNVPTLKRPSPCLAALLAASCAALFPAAACPQTPAPLAEWQFSAGVPLQKLFEDDIPDWQVRLGAAAMVRPRYDGSSEYIFVGGPSIDICYRDLAFAMIGEGIGVNVLRGKNWRAGIALSYNFGRRGQNESPHPDGMGNINPAPEGKLFAEYAVSREFPLVLRIDARRSLGGLKGRNQGISNIYQMQAAGQKTKKQKNKDLNENPDSPPSTSPAKD